MSRSIESNKMDDSTAGSTYIRQDNSSSVPSTRLIESLEESNSSDLDTSKDRFGGRPVGKAIAYEGKVQTVQRNHVVTGRDSRLMPSSETRDGSVVLETCARAVGSNVAHQLVVVTMLLLRMVEVEAI